jgi:hypothetical protein
MAITLAPSSRIYFTTSLPIKPDAPVTKKTRSFALLNILPIFSLPKIAAVVGIEKLIKLLHKGGFLSIRRYTFLITSIGFILLFPLFTINKHNITILTI